MRGYAGLILLATVGLAQSGTWFMGLPPSVGVPAWPARALVLFGMQAVSLALAWRRRDAAALWIVIGIAVLQRGIAVTWPPDLSSDLHRYVWDGNVLDSGRSPYAHPPAAPELTRLRHAQVFQRINRPEVAERVSDTTQVIVL